MESVVPVACTKPGHLLAVFPGEMKSLGWHPRFQIGP
jgi:hypothetical protein